MENSFNFDKLRLEKAEKIMSMYKSSEIILPIKSDKQEISSKIDEVIQENTDLQKAYEVLGINTTDK